MVLVQIALRNLATHKLKSLVVGVLLVFGTMLLVIGTSLLSSLDRSMAQSLVHSIAGHLQVQQEVCPDDQPRFGKARDKLSLFPAGLDTTDVGHIPDFPRVKAALEKLPEVEAVIPMGLDSAIVFGGNVLDGVKLVAKQFEDVMQKMGVVGFPSHGQPFDPAKHEAVGARPDANVPAQHVCEEYQRGYMLHDRLLRPALVIVSSGPPAAEN